MYSDAFDTIPAAGLSVGRARLGINKIKLINEQILANLTNKSFERRFSTTNTTQNITYGGWVPRD